MTGQGKGKLTVTNDQGTTDYGFVLELGDKPPAGESIKLLFFVGVGGTVF